MEHVAPLIQTVLWVGLIGVVLWRFYTPIYGLLTAFQKRIEDGSNIKAGPFELTDQLKPQDPSKQKEKAESEVKEVIQALREITPAQTLLTASRQPSNVQAKYFQAEDLALRALQTEYGSAVMRQITAGPDTGFDGAFVSNGRMNLVEVKYAPGSAHVSRFRTTVERLVKSVERLGWPSVQIILVVVFDNTEDALKSKDLLQELSLNTAIPVVVRSYSLPELQLKFGASNQEG